MRKELLGVALGLMLSGTAAADVLGVPAEPTPAGDAVAAKKLPAKGLSRADLQKQFGEPRNKGRTVGGDAPKHPPITRWDYEGFSVIFEKDRVIDVVVPGAPPKIFNRNQLSGGEPMASAPVAGADAPMAPAPAMPEAAPAQPGEAAPATPADPAEPAAEKVSPQAREAPVQGP